MKKRYEIAYCSICDGEYKKFCNNRTGTCKTCRNKAYGDKYKALRQQNGDRKHLYPLGVNEQRRRYTKIKKILDKCETREQWKEAYQHIINEMIELKIWDWASSKSEVVEGKKNVDENGKPKVGRIGNKETQYEDTRGLQID